MASGRGIMMDVRWSTRGQWQAACLAMLWTVCLAAAPLPGPYAKEHEITVDPTALEPPTRWHVPGVTPIIASLDPDTTDAYSTTEARAVKLKPGQYRFGTFTFDFPFVVTLDGRLDYSPSLDHCVDGRGTQRLTVRCSRMQPYSGEPDYYE